MRIKMPLGVEFFEIGEKFFDSLKKDLHNAKKYILIEFFIFSKGKLWDEIFDILKKKSAEAWKRMFREMTISCGLT